MSESRPSRHRQIASEVLSTEASAIQGLLDQLDESFDQAVELLAQTAGRVICTGMGKSGIVLKKVTATLSSTGTPALTTVPFQTPSRSSPVVPQIARPSLGRNPRRVNRLAPAAAAPSAPSPPRANQIGFGMPQA